MKNLSLSVKIYLGIILFLVLLAVTSILRSYLQTLSLIGEPFAFNELLWAHFFLPFVFTLANVAIAVGLGLVGIVLIPKIGFVELWDKNVTNRHRFLIPALIGTGIGLFLVVFDLIASQFFTIERLYNRQFPASILSALNTGITDELIYRLFFITLFVWLVSRFIVKNRWPNQVFWTVAALSAVTHILLTVIPVITAHQIIERELPVAYIIEIILLSGLVSICAAYYLRKAGFLAAASVHISANIVWLVVWESLIIAT